MSLLGVLSGNRDEHGVDGEHAFLLEGLGEVSIESYVNGRAALFNHVRIQPEWKCSRVQQDAMSNPSCPSPSWASPDSSSKISAMAKRRTWRPALLRERVAVLSCECNVN